MPLHNGSHALGFPLGAIDMTASGHPATAGHLMMQPAAMSCTRRPTIRS
jgi:hypothetical protein